MFMIAKSNSIEKRGRKSDNGWKSYTHSSKINLLWDLHDETELKRICLSNASLLEELAIGISLYKDEINGGYMNVYVIPVGSSIGYNGAMLWSRILLELAERNSPLFQ
ncbi:hypothetical protein SLEP1_g36615 [Rubroshorea leprosula]|uniref:Uncharacterized protein n=1 Tax=Rubroshorea leprosula TaxID=152421 RepID=A0AAV5KSJ0_9ROSI|nr:hypothetical protein SLEP1_g36615 [Rubroshorea leprosula]